MLHIVIATRNRHKFRELVGLLKIRGIRWHSLQEFPQIPAVKETGRTFDANAMRKARAVAKATGYLALADDSGLEVDALGGLPGIQSARYAGSHGRDDANNEKLLRKLRRVSTHQRQAQYRCSLALASPVELMAIRRGRWAGRIAISPAGSRGFGYDPIFVVPQFGKTVGQLPMSVKQRLSHRAKAARSMRVFLIRLVSGLAASGRHPKSLVRSRRAQARVV